MAHAPTRKKEPCSSAVAEQHAMSEIDCLSKMGLVYHKEMELLKSKLRTDARAERVVEFEKRVAAGAALRIELQKKLRDAETQIKDSARAIERAAAKKESGSIQVEVSRFFAQGDRKRSC